MYQIDGRLMQEILNYLATKPYADVFKLIAEIQKLKKVEENG